MADEGEGAPVSDEEMGDDSSVSNVTEKSSDESEDEELFEVDEIVGMKRASNGVKLYKVRWKGYSKANDTWEPIQNLESCVDMVEDFEAKKEEEKKQRADERKRKMALMAGLHVSEETVDDVQGMSSLCSNETTGNLPNTGSTLKDTFWKDLEEGKINLFNTDMYSKVKGQGRASRPKSFKTHFHRHMSDDVDEQQVDARSSQDEDTLKKQSKPRSLAVQGNKAHQKTGKRIEKRKGRDKSHTKKVSQNARKTPKSVVRTKSETSSDASDVLSTQDVSLPSSPSPPVLSCMEDYSDDGSRDLSDHRYSSPADITDEPCGKCAADATGKDTELRPLSMSQGTVSDDTGIHMDVSLSVSSQLGQDTSAVASLCPEELQREETDVCRETSLDDKQKLKKTKDVDKTVEVKKAVSQPSESKSAKKTKSHSDIVSELYKSDKTLNHDSDYQKVKVGHKTAAHVRDSSREGISSAAKTSAFKTGKENVGEKHVTNILSGLSSVISTASKTRGPSVNVLSHGTVSRTEGLTPNVQCDVVRAGCKRKESLSSSDLSQPLEKILNTSSLLPILPDNKASADKAADLMFDIDLDDIDLDELEKQLTLSPSTLPVELSDDELKQAVLDGDYDLVRRALAAHKLYDIEQTDDAGTTLLMHAILGNFDDVAEVLVCSGAKINAQQKNGNSALMIAAEQAHICTVALLIEMGARVNQQQTAGETALMKAVKRGHKQIVRHLLENGANFSYLTYNGYSALSYAKLLRLGDIEDIIVDHISKLTAEFDRQVAITLNNTATIISALFPLQCFPLADNDQFTISFKTELEPITPGVGFLLFIAHARITSTEMKCRFYGPCAVKSVYLNGVKQPSLTEDANFVLSCQPVMPGKNELCIHTEAAVSSKAKLVICAYKAQLIQ